ncbi:secondary thiamine-phosphate synthase enzyme YjbQ [Methanobacterium sp.]|uniref:secondary thiamine-phosphate synthase enzyme YjbQ n=1 Tax=Methanobacterium sp. TaxID=2164 RepID=UPI003C73F279
MFRQVLDIKTDKRIEIKDITQEIQLIVKQSHCKNGIVNIYSKHSTSGIVINENETGLIKDFKSALEDLVPVEGNYNHNCIDNNADSHIRSFIIGSSETVPLYNGKLDLGTWQSIFFVELDGPRNRKITVTIMG